MNHQVAPPRRRSFWLLASLLGVIVLIVVPLVLWLIQSSALQSELDAITAQGLPVSGVTVNDYYQIPAGVSDTTELWIEAINAARTAGSDPAARVLPFVGMAPTPSPPVGVTWEQLPAARSFLEQHADALAVIHAAVQSGGAARFPVDFRAHVDTPLPYTQDSRAVSRLLLLDAHVAAHEGDFDRALNDIHGILRLSRALRFEPTLVSLLVRTAILSAGHEAVVDLLPAATWSDAQLAALQDALRSADLLQGVRRALIGERAASLDAVAQVAPVLFVQSNSCLLLQMFSDSLASLDLGWAGAIEEQKKIAALMQKNATGTLNRLRNFAALLLMPAMEQSTIAAARATAKQRCALCLLAAERHRRQHGAYPDSLEQMQTELFSPGVQNAQDTIDPFTDAPLQYNLSAGHLVIYSVGRDLQDDGGSVAAEDQSAPADCGLRIQRQDVSGR